MVSLIHKIRHDTKAFIEWHEIFVSALSTRDDLGMFPSEFRNWFIDHGHDLNGKVYDAQMPREERKGNPEVRELERMLHSVQQFHVEHDLIRFTMEIPERVYDRSSSVLRLALQDEPCFRLTEKGRKVAGWPVWRQRLYFCWLSTVRHTGPLRSRIKKIAGAAGVVAAVARFVAGWETMHAIAAAAGAAVLTAIFSLGSS